MMIFICAGFILTVTVIRFAFSSFRRLVSGVEFLGRVTLSWWQLGQKESLCY